MCCWRQRLSFGSPSAKKADTVYWGINDGTLVISAEEIEAPIQGSFPADEAFNAKEGIPWLAYKDQITVAKVDGSHGKVQIPDCMDLFYGLEKAETIDVSGLDTKKTTSMWCMFDSCKAVKTLDLSNFDTSNVENMQGMFYQCASLENVNVTSFDTRKVTNMFSMFAGCASLTTLDLSSFDTSNVTNDADMFLDCDKLTEIKQK